MKHFVRGSKVLILLIFVILPESWAMRFDWTNYLKNIGIKVSMDGKGRATDNAWIERFWKTIKYDYS